MTIFLLSIGFGIVTASVLALASVGLTLQFGVTNYVNFAYGAFLTLGAYLTWAASSILHLNFGVAVVVGTLAVGVIAVLCGRYVMGPFVRRRSNLLFLLIVTFGLSLILSNLVQAIWGVDFQTFNLPTPNPVDIGPLIFTPYQLAIVAVAVVVMLVVHLLLTRTMLGKAMRAMSDSADLAQVSGIDTERITTWAWFLSGCLAGLAGIVFALNTVSFEPTFGDQFLFVIFSAVILGGIGQPYGAMLGAVVIGLVTEVSAAVVSSAYKEDIAFLVLVAMLLLRPQGLIPAKGKA